MSSGYFAIGIVHGKTPQNIGTLFRSAEIFGAAFVFTVGARYKQQPGDTLKSWRRVPLYNYATLDDLKQALPFESLLVGVELEDTARPIEEFEHPARGIYLLGAEDVGLTPDEQRLCHRVVRLPGARSLNVSAAGTVVMYDRRLSFTRQFSRLP